MYPPNQDKHFQQDSSYWAPAMPLVNPQSSSFYGPSTPFTQAQQYPETYNTSSTMQYQQSYVPYQSPAIHPQSYDTAAPTPMQTYGTANSAPMQAYNMPAPAPMESYGAPTYTFVAHSSTGNSYAAPRSYPTPHTPQYSSVYTRSSYRLQGSPIQQNAPQMSLNPSIAYYNKNSQYPRNASYHPKDTLSQVTSLSSYNSKNLTLHRTPFQNVPTTAWQVPIEKPATPAPPTNQQPIKSPINNREQLAQKSKGELKLALEKLSMKKKELREKQSVRRTSLEGSLSYIDNLRTSNPGPSALSKKYSPDLWKKSSRETSRLQSDGNFQEGNTINRNDGTNERLKQSAGVEIKPETKIEVRIKLEEVAEPSLDLQNVIEGSVSSNIPTQTNEGTVLGKRTRANEADNHLARRWKEMIQHQRALIDDLEKYVQTQGQVHVPPADNFLETSLKRLKLPSHLELSVPEPAIPSRDASPAPASNVDKSKRSKIRDAMGSLVNSSTVNQVSHRAINNHTSLGKVLNQNHKQVMTVWPPVNDVPTSPHTWADRPSLAKSERRGWSLNDSNHLTSCETLEEHPDKDTLTREQTVEKKTPSVAGSSEASVASSFESSWCLRYASIEEHQNLLRSVDEEKYQARLNGSYLPPKIPEHCFADPDWLPYHCFTCDQTRDTWNGLKTHLRQRHSTIMVDKVQAWECFYPGCSKRFSSREKGIKHAEADHCWERVARHVNYEYGRTTSEKGREITRDEN